MPPEEGNLIFRGYTSQWHRRRRYLWLAVAILLLAAIWLGRPFWPHQVSSMVLTGMPSVRVYIPATRQVRTMSLESYVEGVVAAEMPASFPLPALEAQAVAARTFAVRRMHVFAGGGCVLDREADICADPGTDQAWVPVSELQRRWGAAYAANWDRVTSAVRDTGALILTYEGVPIIAAYGAGGGATTLSANQGWGGTVPYLVPRPNPPGSNAPAGTAPEVGMSQWGAKALASSGYDFQRILAYYYPGTKLSPLFLE